MRRLVLALVLESSCTPAQAPRVHRAAEIAIVSGIVAMVTAGIIAGITNNKLVAHSDYVFGGVTLAGAAGYWVSDNEIQQLAREDAQRKFDAAFALARDAKHAARRNDCAQVQEIEPKVRALDPIVYRRFRHDDIIKACLPATLDPAP
jgi:hypothetical protein